MHGGGCKGGGGTVRMRDCRVVGIVLMLPWTRAFRASVKVLEWPTSTSGDGSFLGRQHIVLGDPLPEELLGIFV